MSCFCFFYGRVHGRQWRPKIVGPALNLEDTPRQLFIMFGLMLVDGNCVSGPPLKAWPHQGSSLGPIGNPAAISDEANIRWGKSPSFNSILPNPMTFFGLKQIWGSSHFGLGGSYFPNKLNCLGLKQMPIMRYCNPQRPVQGYAQLLLGKAPDEELELLPLSCSPPGLPPLWWLKIAFFAPLIISQPSRASSGTS